MQGLRENRSRSEGPRRGRNEVQAEREREYRLDECRWTSIYWPDSNNGRPPMQKNRYCGAVLPSPFPLTLDEVHETGATAVLSLGHRGGGPGYHDPTIQWDRAGVVHFYCPFPSGEAGETSNEPSLLLAILCRVTTAVLLEIGRAHV